MQSFLEIFDIYLLEAMVNGILLGGLLALLALGLNLIFGVIDVTWICYAELVMIGMYGMYFLVQYYGLSYYLAAPLAIVLVAILGALLHYLVIAPLLSAAPINQLLATGGVLFVLQSFATVAFGVDFRNLGIRLPVLAFADMHFSYSRLLAFGAALIGMVVVYFFMTRTYTGTAIRAISQDRQIRPVRARHEENSSSPRRWALRWPACGLPWCCSTTSIPSSPFGRTITCYLLLGCWQFVALVAAFVLPSILSVRALPYLEWVSAGLRLFIVMVHAANRLLASAHELALAWPIGVSR